MAPALGPIGFDITIADPKERIQAYIDVYRNHKAYGGFEALLMNSIKIISADQNPDGDSQTSDPTLARAVFLLEVVPGLCNPMQNMHGGAVALLADMATTMATAPASQPGFWAFGGVSRTLSVNYISPIGGGSTIRVECVLRRLGKRSSITQCFIKDAGSGRLLAMAEHNKAALGAQVAPSLENKPTARI